jgi:predicted metal-dependent peptidase
MKIKETGGTTMQLGPAKLAGEKNKKLLIIFTDGYIDTFMQKEYNFKIMMFLSRGNSHLAESISSRGFRVICQDEE